MIKNIYLDMDGVLCDFTRRYVELFGKMPADARDAKEFNPNWERFIKEQQFRTLDWHPEGQELLRFIKHSIDHERITIRALTSAGGKKFHKEVEEQKKFWLAKNEFHYEAIVVTNRKMKAEYANEHSILVDDTPDVIEAFNAAGGHGILHTNTADTIRQIKNLVRRH